MMRHFVIFTLYVQIFLYIKPIQSDTHTVKGFLQDVILRKFLEQILRPYARTYQSNKKHIIISRSYKETSIEKAIEDKIKELKPFLQDNDDLHDSGDKLTLEGNDETTIVEYVPKSTKENSTENDELNKFKENIENYKNMRHKIEKLLNKENVPEDTKKMVTKTLDEMISQLIENQCTWKKVTLSEELFPNRQPKFTSAKELTSKEWLEVKNHYTNLIKNQNIKESLTFLHQSFDFFSKIAKHFNVQCRFVNGAPKDFARRHGKTNHKYNCDNFKVCTNELRKFFTHFYKSLNKTVVSTFRNYAEMYSRDVNIDESHEKNQVISTITNISYIIEHKVSLKFKKELKKLTLDPKKNKEANKEALRHFVIDTGNHVMKYVTKHLKTHMKTLSAKKISIIKEDLTVNLKMDLDNLEKKRTDKICNVFAVCNNNYLIDGKNTKRALDISDTKNIYVKVQLSLDDELKDELASRLSETRQTTKKKEHHFIVTRTTQDNTYSNPFKSYFKVSKSGSNPQNTFGI